MYISTKNTGLYKLILLVIIVLDFQRNGYSQTAINQYSKTSNIRNVSLADCLGKVLVEDSMVSGDTHTFYLMLSGPGNWRAPATKMERLFRKKYKYRNGNSWSLVDSSRTTRLNLMIGTGLREEHTIAGAHIGATNDLSYMKALFSFAKKGYMSHKSPSLPLKPITYGCLVRSFSVKKPSSFEIELLSSRSKTYLRSVIKHSLPNFHTSENYRYLTASKDLDDANISIIINKNSDSKVKYKSLIRVCFSYK